MERVDALEAQIRDTAHKLEDVIEFFELKQLQPKEGDEEGVMRQEIRSFGERAKRLEKEYLAELSREDDDDEYTTYPDFGVEMIGRSGLFKKTLKRHVLNRMRPDDRCTHMFLGEQGSGTRVVVKTVSENARRAGEFECWGWVKVGTGYELKHVLMSLIAQVEANVNDEMLVDASEDGLSEYLYKALENRRYMIVLDGVDDTKLVEHLNTTSFPDQSNGSLVLVTTNSREVALYGDEWYSYTAAETYEEDFWFYIRHTFFGWESIPAELEVAGKEIVHNCRGRFSSLAKTVVFLSKSDMTVEEWSKIAADKDNPIFTIVDELSESSEIKNETEYCETNAAHFALSLIGFSTQLEDLNEWMYPERFFSKLKIISFIGMTGIGKTTLVTNIFKKTQH